jgi:hypothetical protein
MRADGQLRFGDGTASTDVNLFRDAVDVLRTNDALTVDGALTASGALTVAGDFIATKTIRKKVKTATQTKNSDTTLADDSQLTLPVDANTRYAFTAYINYQGPAAGDFKSRFTIPAGAAAQGVNASSEETDAVNSRDLTASFNVSTSGGTGPASDGYWIAGSVVTAGTAGSITFQWAQATSDPGSTSVREGSWIKLERE